MHRQPSTWSQATPRFSARHLARGSVNGHELGAAISTSPLELAVRLRDLETRPTTPAPEPSTVDNTPPVKKAPAKRAPAKKRGKLSPWSAPRAIFRIWPDFPIKALLVKSVSTVKADAAHSSFSREIGTQRGAVADALRYSVRLIQNMRCSSTS